MTTLSRATIVAISPILTIADKTSCSLIVSTSTLRFYEMVSSANPLPQSSLK
ncbi:predicted protein [Arabidopsis lyrata subsp. lyrata]|uniref:Predicted protein n=1 Tax=Arabidopsis lyrata subsp. lyrata TaxID=81972 RepID=D7KUX6_ARALL|nr:predicted protein [Arabidopsis lyrata subsp. lyrata]